MKNSYKKYLFIFVLFLFISFENVAAYNDKTSVVSRSYIATSDCIMSGALGGGHISVNHRVGMSSGNYLVNPGAPINFYYNPDEPYFVQGSGTWDTPYGEWTDSVDSRYYANFGSFDVREPRSFFRGDPPVPYMEYIIDHGQFFCGKNCRIQYGYFYWTAVKPAVSIVSSNPSVISCSGMNCTAVSPGVATLTSNIDQTKSRAWAYVDYVMDKYVREKEGLTGGPVYKRIKVIEGVYCPNVVTNGISPGSFHLPSTAMSWTVTVNDPTPVNGSCGTRNTTYPSTTPTWIGGSTLCSAGTAAPASVAFPAPGASASWQCRGISGGTTASCNASRAAAIINGTCGTKNRNYLFSETVAAWNSNSYCNSGTASFPSGAVSFPSPATSTANWSCDGSGGGTTVTTCKASRQAPPPTVTLTASPTSLNLNNGTTTVSAKNSTLTWNITNAAASCGTGCTCTATSSWSGNKTYPNSQAVTIGSGGSHTYTLTCTNPSGGSGSASATINASCNVVSWDTPCGASCAEGITTHNTIQNNCTISSTNSTCDTGMTCPDGVKYKEIGN